MTTDVESRWRSRYRKQIILKEIGLVGQGRIMQGSVLVVGAGGLGGIVSILLVRAGLGTVRIVDSDVVEEENLHRQLLFTEAHVAARMAKAEAAADVLRSINSASRVHGIVTMVTAETMPGLLDGMKVVVDATDSFQTRDVINTACMVRRIPWVHGGILGTEGAVMTVIPREGPCLRCLYPVLPQPDARQTTGAVGILNTLPALIGSLQVTEALRLLVGEPPREKRLLQIDPWHGEYHGVAVDRDPDCPACGRLAEGGEG